MVFVHNRTYENYDWWVIIAAAWSTDLQPVNTQQLYFIACFLLLIFWRYTTSLHKEDEIIIASNILDYVCDALSFSQMQGLDKDHMTVKDMMTLFVDVYCFLYIIYHIQAYSLPLPLNPINYRTLILVSSFLYTILFYVSYWCVVFSHNITTTLICF